MCKTIAATLLALGFAGLSWAQTLDLNQATEIELDALKGLGPALTQELMNERKKMLFKDWDDVTRRVKGLGPQKAKSLSEQGVQVQGRAFSAPAPAAKPSDAAGTKAASTKN